MSNNTIIFKRKSPILLNIFGVGFFIVGLIATFTGNLLGLIFCLVSILFFQRKGSEIQLKSKRYRTFTDILGIRFATWKNLPEIDYISVFRTNETIIIKDFVKQTKMTTKCE